jgi:hypothetical protein
MAYVTTSSRLGHARLGRSGVHEDFNFIIAKISVTTEIIEFHEFR